MPMGPAGAVFGLEAGLLRLVELPFAVGQVHGALELERFGIQIWATASGAGCASAVLLKGQRGDIATHRVPQVLAISLSAFIFGTDLEWCCKAAELLVGIGINGHRANVDGFGIGSIAGPSPGGEPL